jgi:hypothetical protein
MAVSMTVREERGSLEEPPHRALAGAAEGAPERRRTVSRVKFGGFELPKAVEELSD